MIKVDDIKWYNTAKNHQYDNLVNSKINQGLIMKVQKINRDQNI